MRRFSPTESRRNQSKEEYPMDTIEGLHERVDVLEHQIEALIHRSHLIERRLRVVVRLSLWFLHRFELTDQEISLVVPILQRLVWSDKETRAKIQKFELNVLPINFYSNTPSIEEIESSYEYTVDEPPYFNPKVFDQKTFRRTLEQLLEFSMEFNPPLDGDEDNCQRFFW